MERAELSQALRAWRSRETGAGGPGPILISEPDPVRFMTAFAEAVAGDAEVFLCDPNWGPTEKAQVRSLLALKIEDRKFGIDRGWLMIPSGGSSGQIKFARHDQDTIAPAVGGFKRHFGLRPVNAIGVLPLHHVSGLMAWMRCALTDGEFRPCDWKSLEAGERPELSDPPDGWVISLVPTQLERLLRDPGAGAWLKTFRVIILGGAPAWPELLERAAARGLPLSLSYGMTETAAMVTASRPEEFLAWVRSCGRPLMHATVGVDGEGAITVDGASLFRGYYPDWRGAGVFRTGDLGRLDGLGHLHVTGRRDGLIITGGEKVQPAEVEAVLRATGEFADVVVVGVPDAEWGHAVLAAYPSGGHPDLGKVMQLIDSRLVAWKQPKQFLAIEPWPVTGTGKVNRAEVTRLITEQLPLPPGSR